MIVFAIETSCDETAAAVIQVTKSHLNNRGERSRTTSESFDVHSNIISSQVKLHAKYGGVVPSLASREHAKNIGHVAKKALRKAKIKNFKKEIDIIAVTHGPGLGPSLIVGVAFARTLSWHYKKPIFGVNHMEGHIYSNWLAPTRVISNFQFPISKKNQKQKLKTKTGNWKLTADNLSIFPALNLLVSGGHTELVLMHGHGKYELIGETLDDAVGEAFDKVARLLGLKYPGGPEIAKIAEQGDPERYPLPQPMLNSKNFDFSYSGLKTAVLYLLRDNKEWIPSTGSTHSTSSVQAGSPQASSGQYQLSHNEKADIAASFQKAAIDVLVTKTRRAAKTHNAKSILLSGGVSANTYLRKSLHHTATELGVQFYCPPMKYTGDNAVMIAVAGYFNWKQKKHGTPWQSLTMEPNLSLTTKNSRQSKL